MSPYSYLIKLLVFFFLGTEKDLLGLSGLHARKRLAKGNKIQWPRGTQCIWSDCSGWILQTLSDGVTGIVFEELDILRQQSNGYSKVNFRKNNKKKTIRHRHYCRDDIRSSRKFQKKEKHSRTYMYVCMFLWNNYFLCRKGESWWSAALIYFFLSYL